jgi:hypothetical protein
MTPNEFLLDETRQWLAKAHSDLRAAEVALVNDIWRKWLSTTASKPRRRP